MPIGRHRRDQQTGGTGGDGEIADEAPGELPVAVAAEPSVAHRGGVALEV